MTKNLKLIDLTIHTTSDRDEVAIVHDICRMIKDNSTLETVYISLTNHTNCISILDACAFKPKIDEIILTCSDELSKEVIRHIKMFKNTHIFKSVHVYMSTHKPKPKNWYCAIF